MTKYILTLSLLLFSFYAQAQLTATANADNGSGYPAILAAGLDIENPDCEHTSFGPHITQLYDAGLDRNVFAFHSHIVEDNDRCLVFDRVRMEIKGGPNTDPEAQHLEGDTSYYRWKFRLADDFVGASSFCHLFQNKAKGGSDSSFPIITITARTNRVEVLHNGGDSGIALGQLAQAELSNFRGRWVEVYLMQVHREDGALAIHIKDMATGQAILEYENDNIDLWRSAADYNRPKWGIYRSRADGLQDEIVHFANFCISETSAELCPGEAVLVEDTTPPNAPTNLIATNISISSVDLSWNEASDDFGVTAYEVLQDGQVVATTAATEETIPNLTGGTAYTFVVRAKDEAGNTSANSNELMLTTDPADALPDVVTNPFPPTGATGLSITTILSWQAGDNTDSYNIRFGTESEPGLVTSQTGTSYAPTLMTNTTYYWQIVSVNTNGSTESPIWTFSTGEEDSELPWIVYRADARLEEEVSVWELESVPEVPLADEVITDPIVASNNFYAYRYDGDTKFRWRSRLSEEDSTVTIVARLMPQSPDVNGMCHIEIRAGGWRQKVRLNDGNIKLEATTPVIERDLDFDWDDQMHVIRVVARGPETTIYLDEDPEPFLSGMSDEETGLTYLDYGKGGGSDYGATTDWLAFDLTGAYAPGEGTPLPEDLILSNDAALSSVSVNGTPLTGFFPAVLEYNVDLPSSELPAVNWTTRSAFATAVLTNPSNSEGTQSTIVVTADDEVSTRTYTLNYLVVDIDEAELAEWLRIFPNPATDYVQINLAPGQQATANLFNQEGQLVKAGLQINKQAQWNISDLPAGAYLLQIGGRNVPLRYYKLLIQ